MITRRALPLTLTGLLAGAAQARAAVWVSHDVPPYVWQSQRGVDGYGFKLYEQVTRRAGLAVQLQLVPFARGLRMLEAGHAEAALVLTRSPDREARFRWLYPVGRFRLAVLTLLNAAAAPSAAAQLKGLRVGSLRASVSRSWLEQSGVSGVVEGKDYVELLAMLRRGIVDAVVGPEAVLRATEARERGEGLRVTVMDGSYDVYAAAGPAMSEAAVQRVRAAYQELAEAGVVAQLRKAHPEALAPG
jgi:polar amino acid transport system substrate-binding protein